MPRLKTTLKFSTEEAPAVLRMADAVQLDVDTFCKRAVLYAINDSHRRAAEFAAQQKQQKETTDVTTGNNTQSPDIGGDPVGQVLGEDASSDTLPDTDSIRDTSSDRSDTVEHD